MEILDSITELKQSKKTKDKIRYLNKKLNQLKLELENVRLNPLHEREEVQAIKKKIDMTRSKLIV